MDKRCPKCDTWKPVTEFYVDNSTKDGRASMCAECRKGYMASRDNPVTVCVKQCTTCNEIKPAEAFSKHRHSPDGLRYSCRECRAWTALYEKYKVTKEQALATLETQKWSCVGCLRHIGPVMGKKGFVVDHCHTTGRVRAFLCLNCNTGEGMLKDMPGFNEWFWNKIQDNMILLSGR